jgi:hypothetical protein
MRKVTSIRLSQASLEDVQNNLKKEFSKINHATGQGFLRAGLFLLRQSKKQVPVDTGNLRASGFLVVRTRPGRVVTHRGNVNLIKSRFTPYKKWVIANTKVRTEDERQAASNELQGINTFGFSIVYSAVYAAVQHEEPAYYHEVGNWKYLQKPMMEHKDDIIKLIKASVRQR